jgi:hypothetical protein
MNENMKKEVISLMQGTLTSGSLCTVDLHIKVACLVRK